MYNILKHIEADDCKCKELVPKWSPQIKDVVVLLKEKVLQVLLVSFKFIWR